MITTFAPKRASTDGYAAVVSSHRSSFDTFALYNPDKMCWRSGFRGVRVRVFFFIFSRSLWLSAASRVPCSSPQPPARTDKWRHLGKSDAGIKLMNDTLHINSLHRQEQCAAGLIHLHPSSCFFSSSVFPVVAAARWSLNTAMCFQQDLTDLTVDLTV